MKCFVLTVYSEYRNEMANENKTMSKEKRDINIISPWTI